MAQQLPDTSLSQTCKEHSFLTDVSDVRKMEQGLLALLDDFHSGRLQAFGEESYFEKMDQVREQQERLAKLHFDMDTDLENIGLESEEARKVADENLSKLVTDLQQLSQSIITGLHVETAPPPPTLLPPPTSASETNAVPSEKKKRHGHRRHHRQHKQKPTHEQQH